TNTTGKDGNANVLEVTTESTKMREGTQGNQYTDFSPENIFLGLNAGVNTTPTVDDGSDNVFIGNDAGVTNINGEQNVFIGKGSGHFNDHPNGAMWLEGNFNVFVGYQSGYSNTSGGCNVFLGVDAGLRNEIGTHNIYIGTEAGMDNVDGNTNTIVGSDAFIGASGSGNTYIGHLSGTYATGSNNVFIGRNTGDHVTDSNRLFIDNSVTATPLIYGEFDNDIVTINGKLGVGVSPTYKIHSVETTATSDNPAVYGIQSVTDWYGIGVKGVGRYRGVEGLVSSASGSVSGIYGTAEGAGTGNRYGVYGTATGGDTAWAGYFAGNVNVTGTLSKGAGSFKIDHPLDPENKYLYHSFVESPDMKNIYDGVVILDNNGEASVTLPSYFEALNDKFRYQLTAIGAPAPNLYIAEEILNNKFKISGGTAGMKISWMVTGIRKDNFANNNRIPIEVEKTDSEKGYYLHPEAFGMQKEEGIDFNNRKKIINSDGNHR
ncbi:MAG: hypothetical protein GQ534_10090, partial [Candidatus Delongbacteria bacterium]|nr:hypothetical protein [Candidatus Delongbacteria bacterium]